MLKIVTDTEIETQGCEKSILILRLRLRDVKNRYQYWDWDQQVSQYRDDIDSIVRVCSIIIKQNPLTYGKNSSQETTPIGTYDIPLELSYYVERQREVRFPGILVKLE